MPDGRDGKLRRGNKEIKAIYRGDRPVKAVYYGDKQVWVAIDPPGWTQASYSYSRTRGSSFSINVGNLVIRENSITRISGSLPPGISFSNNVISGTPSSTGSYTSTYRASNIAGSVDRTIAITVNSPAPSVPFSLSGTGNRTRNTNAQSNFVTTVNGNNPSITITSYPSWVSLAYANNSSTSRYARLSGRTPSSPGTYTVSGTASASGTTQSFSYTITVVSAPPPVTLSLSGVNSRNVSVTSPAFSMSVSGGTNPRFSSVTLGGSTFTNVGSSYSVNPANPTPGDTITVSYTATNDEGITRSGSFTITYVN